MSTTPNYPAPTRPKGPGNVTQRDVNRFPAYYLAWDGPGRPAAQESWCDHGYRITDSCPCCP